MLRRIRSLPGLPIVATDGEIGKLKDVYFDDLHWAVRYLVVDTGGWLAGRKVLISPYSVSRIDWEGGGVELRLRKQQVQDSPDIDTDKPVSRQYETDFMRYYGYPDYWGGPLLWGATAYPFFDVGAPLPVAERESEYPRRPGDPHLRSAAEVAGYRIQACDDAIGHLEDLLFEPDSWAVRYLIVDTRNWWPGQQVVIPPRWIEGMDWPEHRVKVGVSRAQVKEAPRFDPAQVPTREYEEQLHAHYRREGYWGKSG
ncbi:MAG TPA: PRC-barrel domain-containing protein [Nevskia sp.]|nr:PRC-barrel domain-containing protein [Nevskia sp.]